MNHQQLNFLDHAVLIGYFALILVVSLYLIVKEKKTSTANASSDYFLGGKNLSWFVIGASLFASNIGSEHLVGLAGAGAAGDFPLLSSKSLRPLCCSYWAGYLFRFI